MGDDSFEKVYNENNSNEGGPNMCDVVERIINRGRAEGQQQQAIEAAIKNIQKYNATPEEAANDMGAPLDKVLERLKELENQK